MARATILVTSLTFDAATAAAAGTAIDATNHHASPVLVSALDSYTLVVTNTTAAAKNVTIKAGDNPPADASGQGDLVVAFADGSVTPVVKNFVLTSARFMQNDGTLLVDVEAGTTGFIQLVRTPRG